MTKNTELIVLAGGKGSRLGSLTQSAQKCALEISGKPFFIHVLGQTRNRHKPLNSSSLV